MHPAGPHDTEVTKQKSYASSYSTRCKCGKVHPLSIKKVPLFDTIATLIYAESTAKLEMMFCAIAIVFNDHQRLERVYQFYTNSSIYYSICSTVCAVTTETIVYAVLCVKLIYSLRLLNIITRPPRGRDPQFGKSCFRVIFNSEINGI